jgi:hypothetical protein
MGFRVAAVWVGLEKSPTASVRTLDNPAITNTIPTQLVIELSISLPSE